MMKKFWLASVGLLALGMAAPALAADLGAAQPYVKAPPPPPPPPFSWTGFYVGANIGGAWAHTDLRETFFDTDLNNNNNGRFIGGGQIGGNYQIGQFVIGGEWDFDWASNNNNNNAVFINGFGPFAVTNNNDRWVTTVAARFGWAFDRWLVYGKAGGGWVNNNNNFTLTNLGTGASFTTFSCDIAVTNCGNHSGGWLVGAGFEYAFTNNWTVKFEYDYLGLSNRTFVIPVGADPTLGGDTFTTHNRNLQMVKVGVNYLFNWGAPYPGHY